MLMRQPTKLATRSATAAAAAAVIVLVVYGCGTDRPPAGVIADRGNDTTLFGPCSPEGATSACHAVISQHNGIVNCFEGTQTCTGGSWSPCGGDANGGTISTHAVSGPGLHIESLTDASASGNPCAQDPCAVGCVGYNENPPTPLFPPCGAGGFLVGSKSPDNFKDPLGDFADNQPQPTCIAPIAGCVSRYTVNDNATKCDDCQFDMKCVSGACVPWGLNGQAVTVPADCVSPNRVDFTVEAPCLTPWMPGPATDFHITVCNRGLDDAQAGTLRIGAYDPDRIQYCVGPTGPNGNSPKGGREARVDLTTVIIKAGSCVEINSSNSTVTDLTGVVKPVNEFISQWGGGGAVIIPNWNASVPECNPCNNDNGWDDQVTCTSVGITTQTVTQTYDGVCPPGFKPQWGTLAYSVTTPPLTDIKFAVSTGPAVTGPWTPTPPVQVAKAAGLTGDHPDNCSMTGPSPCGAPFAASCKCPIDLYPPLTAPGPLTPANANQEFLQLSIGFDATVFGCFSGTPTTTTGTSAGCSGGQDVNGGGCNLGNEYTNCQQDFHCNLTCVGGSNPGVKCYAAADCLGGGTCTGGGTCIWNQPPSSPANWFDPDCKFAGGAPGVDLTIGYPCGSTVPVCNRGPATWPGGHVQIGLDVSPSTWDCGATPGYTGPASGVGACGGVGQPPCGPTGKGAFNCTLAPLAPGQCIPADATMCPGLSFGTGQRRMYINTDGAVHECGEVAAAGEYGASCRNNTTAIKATGSGCPPTCGGGGGALQPSVNNWQVVYSCVGAE